METENEGCWVNGGRKKEEGGAGSVIDFWH